MCNETIFRILNLHYPSEIMHSTSLVRHSTVPSLPRLVRALIKIPLAFMREHFSAVCPYSDRRKLFYYFRHDTSNNEPPDDQVSALDLVDRLASYNQLQKGIHLGNNMPNMLGGLGGEGEGGGGGGRGGAWSLTLPGPGLQGG